MSDVDYQLLLRASFRFVSFRPRSEKEFRDFLNKKLKKHHVYGPNLLEKVIQRLRDLGYLDDAKFVSWWIDQRQTHNPKGMRLIAQELKAKGISDELVKPLLVRQGGQYFSDRNENDPDREVDETVLAKSALSKKLRIWQPLPKLERKKKIYSFLGRRGFSGDTIGHVIDEIEDRTVQ